MKSENVIFIANFRATKRIIARTFIFATGLIASFAFIVSPAAQAATWFWDGRTIDNTAVGDGISQGTAGNWDTTTLNWDQGATLPHTNWDSAMTASFGGTGAAVAVTAGGITTSGMIFTSTGYSFTGGTISMASGAVVKSAGNMTTTFAALTSAESIVRLQNTTTTNNFANTTIWTVAGGGISGTNAVVITGNGASTAAIVSLTGTLSYSGGTTVQDKAAVDFTGTTFSAAFADSSINMGLNSTVLRTGFDNTFLKKLATTTNTITIISRNSNSSAIDLSGASGGRDLSNASLAFWDNVGTAGFAFTGLITAGSNGYLFGSTRAGNNININNGTAQGGTPNVLSGSASMTLILGSLGNMRIWNQNSFTGNTLNNASGKTITIGHNLAIQNSAINTAGAGTYILDPLVTTPTIGGLIGSKNLLTSVFASTGYNAMTSLTLNPNSGSVTYSGVIANSTGGLALIKKGAGTQAFANANTYSGGTTVNAGTLLVQNTGSSGTGSGAVTVSAGTTHGTLGGTGTINASSIAVTGDAAPANNAVLMVGNTHGSGGSAQTLTLGASGNIDLGGMLQFDIIAQAGTGSYSAPAYATQKYDQASSNDQLIFTSASNISLTGVLTVAPTDGSAFMTGDTWRLVDWNNIASRTVAFTSFNLPTLSGSNTWDVLTDQSNFNTFGTISVINSVPEPSRAVLLLFGATGLLLRRRRKLA